MSFRFKIFIAHAASDGQVAREVAAILEGNDFDVFIDRDPECLPPAEEFHARIRQAIAGCDIFMLLLSAAVKDPTKYVWTEVSLARKRFRKPQGRVLVYFAANVGDTQVQDEILQSIKRIEPWLTENLTIPYPVGSIPVAIADVAAAMRAKIRAQRVKLLLATAVMILIPAGSFLTYRGLRGHTFPVNESHSALVSSEPRIQPGGGTATLAAVNTAALATTTTTNHGTQTQVSLHKPALKCRLLSVGGYPRLGANEGHQCQDVTGLNFPCSPGCPKCEVCQSQ